VALQVHAAQSHEPEVRISAFEESFEEFPHARRQGTVALAEAVVPHPEEFLDRVLDDLLELVGRRAGAVERRRSRRGRELGHEET